MDYHAILRRQPPEAEYMLSKAFPCPYLQGQQARKVFTELLPAHSQNQYDDLIQIGFRRAQNILSQPTCEWCRACVPLRIVVGGFAPGRTMRRIWKKNADLCAKALPPSATPEQYALFHLYHKTRHKSGEMQEMEMLEYKLMVEETQVQSRLVEYRQPSGKAGEEGPLVAAALTDRVADGLCMAHSFYDVSMAPRSLGIWMILEHIERTRRLGLPYLYLGYWVKGARGLGYKIRFKPQERRINGAWRRVG